MKQRIVFTLVSLTLAVAAIAADSADATRRNNQIFETLEQGWARALVAADKTELDRYEAPEYILVNAAGITLTKAQSDGDLLNGNQHFDALDISAVKARRSGNLAVVTGHAKTRENYKGQDNSGDYEFVDVFERRNGQWLAVRAQLTRVAAAPK